MEGKDNELKETKERPETGRDACALPSTEQHNNKRSPDNKIVILKGIIALLVFYYAQETASIATLWNSTNRVLSTK